MAEKLEDLNLPPTSVQKIIKEALPESVIVGKDVKAAIAKAASMFILFITSQSTQLAQKANRKTLLPEDIYEALEEAEFEELLEPLKQSVKEFKESKPKKDGKTPTKKGETAEDEMEDDDEEDEGITEDKE